VRPIDVTGCLHLKTGCTFIGRKTILANTSWIDAQGLKEFDIIEVPLDEPGAGNALVINNTVVIPNSFPQTLGVLRARGFNVETVDISELLKAEAGLTCMSILFENNIGPQAEN
jgi:dimethylargininase